MAIEKLTVIIRTKWYTGLFLVIGRVTGIYWFIKHSVRISTK